MIGKDVQKQIDGLVNDLIVALTEDFEVSKSIKAEVLKEVQKKVSAIKVEEILMDE